MKGRKNGPNTYDVNLVKRHDDNSAINTEQSAELTPARSAAALAAAAQEVA